MDQRIACTQQQHEKAQARTTQGTTRGTRSTGRGCAVHVTSNNNEQRCSHKSWAAGLVNAHLAAALFFSAQVKIALAQSLVSSSRWLPFDEGARPSFRPRLLGPQASSEVEPKDGPADTRPLRNIIQGAARTRGLPAMLPALPCAFLSKRTRARIATLLSSMPPARLRPATCIPSWQACPRES